MPTPADAFFNATVIKFTVLSLSWSIHAPTYDNSGSRQVVGLCVSKATGLDFKLNAKDMGFSAYDVDIHFMGKELSTDAQGNSLVQWTVQENPNKYFPGPDFNLDSIRGTLSATIAPITPALP